MQSMNNERITRHIVNGVEITVELFDRPEGGGYVTVGDRKFSMGGKDPVAMAETGWKAANPKPTPERLEAMKLAEQRGEKVCDRCGGHGGWRGWPGWTCYDCDGRRTI